jgi:hypothetical protein
MVVVVMVMCPCMQSCRSLAQFCEVPCISGAAATAGDVDNNFEMTTIAIAKAIVLATMIVALLIVYMVFRCSRCHSLPLSR